MIKLIFSGRKFTLNNLNNPAHITIKGKPIDDHTRCVHYHSERDIIAIRMKCCNEYYPCIECHTQTAGHASELWQQAEFDTKAILCGACHTELSINQYLNSNHQCPVCAASFNPGCSNHYHYYFVMEK